MPVHLTSGPQLTLPQTKVPQALGTFREPARLSFPGAQMKGWWIPAEGAKGPEGTLSALLPLWLAIPALLGLCLQPLLGSTQLGFGALPYYLCGRAGRKC